MKVHIHGMGVAGVATLEALSSRGLQLSISDDATAVGMETGPSARAHLMDLADRHNAHVVELSNLDQHLGLVDQLVPAPGVPEGHRVISMARGQGCEVVSEIELAYRIEQDRPGGPRPMIAVTATDGKTTTCLLTAAILRAAGLRSEVVGNSDTPLIAALDSEIDVFVVECSSFRLAWTQQFRAEAGVWLNLAPDHLNWHRSMDSYEAAKAKIFSLQSSSDVAIGNLGDPVVAKNLRNAPGRRVGFGAGPLGTRGSSQYWSDGQTLWGPEGELCQVAEMWRGLPHDQLNVLAASAAVLEIGRGTVDQIRAAVAEFPGVEHRIEFVAQHEGVSWFNDSKATTPHAAAAAIAGFDSVVLIAGGRNKDLDLSSMRVPDRIRSVVAIGEAAGEIAAIFGSDCPVEVAGSMREAVQIARSVAVSGDVVLLSPGCASFDWYPTGGYAARGDHFRDLVRSVINTSYMAPNDPVLSDPAPGSPAPKTADESES